MAVVLYLVAIIGGVVVGDLVLENPTADQVTVFNQPVSGYTDGTLLAMAAALGFVVAVLLVASMNSTTRRRARRKQHRAISAGTQPQTTKPEPEQEQPAGGVLPPPRNPRRPRRASPAGRAGAQARGTPDRCRPQHGHTRADRAPPRILPPADQPGRPPA
jgi:uncharacterized membrane protein YciS (DUF1049 family)